MRNAFITEFKTAVRLKSFWICMAVFFAFFLYLYGSSYSSGRQTLGARENMYHEILQMIREEEGEDVEVDTTDLQLELTEMYKAYHPNQFMNVSYQYFLGVGAIILSISASIFIGNDYRRGQGIKAKLTYYSLEKVFLAKLLVLLTLVAGMIIIFSAVSAVSAPVFWKMFLEKAFNEFPVSFEKVAPAAGPIFGMMGVSVAYLLFFMLCCVLMSVVFKSSLAGIITLVALNLIPDLTKFAPNRLFMDLASRVFTVNEGMSFAVNARPNTVPVGGEIALLAGYFVVLLGGYFYLGFRQKN